MILRSFLSMSVNPKVFFDINVSNKPFGRVVMEVSLYEKYIINVYFVVEG